MSEPKGTQAVNETWEDYHEYVDDEGQLGEESDEYEVGEDQVRRLNGGFDLGLTLHPGRRGRSTKMTGKKAHRQVFLSSPTVPNERRVCTRTQADCDVSVQNSTISDLGRTRQTTTRTDSSKGHLDFVGAQVVQPRDDKEGAGCHRCLSPLFVFPPHVAPSQ